ncbi:MAG: protein kinase [Polyangiaceae bacterium]|nr:protein kinase [Polyangiaceae bacterium]
MSEPTTPPKLDQFEIIRRLGAGGMAEVFLAKKRGAEGTYKLLVVKRILPSHVTSRRFKAMFAEEAQLATRLNHPNIVQVYDFQDYGPEGQILTMEYVEGPDLRKLARAARAQNRHIPPYVAACIVGEVAKGLHYAHERRDEAGKPMDIVHRDVSPQNVLLSYDGAVKIADFGIASANLFREEPGVLKGKTGYMSPEQARGEKVDRRTDIYSLGVVFHELLTGRPLHGAAEGAELFEAVREGVVEPPSTFAREIPPALESIVMKALERQPSDRFTTARDMAAAISRALFQQQQLVDMHVLESVIAEFVNREHTSPGVRPGPGTASSSSSAEGSNDSRSSVGREPASHVDPQDLSEASRLFHRRLRERAGREVRHVAVLTVRIHGLEQLDEAAGAGNAGHFVEQLRGILDEIAFKRGARLSWEGIPASARGKLSGTARAVIGLMADPARSAADAAWLAVDIHEAIQGAVEDMPVLLQASVGMVRAIATGRRDPAGHLVRHTLKEGTQELADILANQAPASSTWVAGGLYRLVRRDFVWGDAPILELEAGVERNLPRQMRLHSLLRPLTREERLKEMAHASSDFVGRSAELADLHAAYHRAANPEPGTGSGQVAARVVYGEMGIGKTALISAFISELPPETPVVRAEASPSRIDLAYSALAEWIQKLARTRGGLRVSEATEVLSELLRDDLSLENPDAAVSCLAEILTGGIVTAADEADAVQNRLLITAGLRSLLSQAARQAAVVLVLEGAHWCDRPTLEVVSELRHVAVELPVLLIVVSRPDDRVVPFTDGMVRMELRGLSSDDQIRLLQTRLGATHGVEQACADVLPRVAGNPFVLLEMVDALLERGALELRERGDGSYELLRSERADDEALRIPSTLEQLVADRLNELPIEEQEIVEWLAVAGGPLDLADLGVVLRKDSDEVVTRLCARGLCDRTGNSIDVRQPLTRDVAYSNLDSATRVAMHRRLGEHLATTPLATGLTAAIVARHLARGHAKREAALCYLTAGRAARASYQLKLAARCFRRAGGLLAPDDEHMFDVHEALEAIARVQGRQRERREHLDALRQQARASGNSHRVVTALLRTARMELEAGRLSKALASAEQAGHVARSVHSAISEVQAQSLTADVYRDLGDLEHALGAVDRALETAEDPEVPARLRAEVLRGRGILLRRLGRVDESMRTFAEAIAVSRKVGAQRLESRAKNSLAFAMFVLGQYEDAVALGLESIRLELALGGRAQLAKTLTTIGESYAALGDVPRGLAYLKRVRQTHKRNNAHAVRMDTLLAMARVLIEHGAVGEAEALVTDAGALASTTGSVHDQMYRHLLGAVLARARGKPDIALVAATEAQKAAESLANTTFRLYASSLEAAARLDLGEREAGKLAALGALTAVEALQGSEFGLATRVLCCHVLDATEAPEAAAARARSANYVRGLFANIRDDELRRAFAARPTVTALVDPSELLDSKPPVSDT